jgi:primase-polymerase (primpol)-like protein
MAKQRGPAVQDVFRRAGAARLADISEEKLLFVFQELTLIAQARLLPRADAKLVDRLRRNVLPELQAGANWVGCDRSPERKQTGIKSSKKPLDPNTGNSASVSDPTTWGTFEQACAFALRDSRAATIGFNLLGTDYLGIDFDHVIDEQGALHPTVRELLSKLPGTYRERSPSGRGVRMFYRGRKPTWMQGCKWPLPGDAGAVEIYDSSDGRYLTVTGDVFDLEAV